MKQDQKKEVKFDRAITFLINCIVAPLKFFFKIATGLVFGLGLSILLVLAAIVLGFFGFIIFKLFKINIDFNNFSHVISTGAFCASIVLHYFIFRSLVVTRLGFIRGIRQKNGNYPNFYRNIVTHSISAIASLVPFVIILILGIFYHPKPSSSYIANLQLANSHILGQITDTAITQAFSLLLPYYYISGVVVIALVLTIYFGFFGKWVSVRRMGTSVRVDKGPWHTDVD